MFLRAVAVVAGSTASCSAASTVTETLSDIKALLEKVIKKVENNEAAIKELKEQFSRFEIYLIMPNSYQHFSRQTTNKIISVIIIIIIIFL